MGRNGQDPASLPRGTEGCWYNLYATLFREGIVFAYVPTGSNSETQLEFTVLGDTINRAGRLSDFARDGSVWVTKNILGRLTPEERSRVHFGIRRGSDNGEDILGNNPPPYPRHSKQYRNLYKLKQEMQAERVAGFKEFVDDVQQGRFPGREHVITASDDLIEEFVKAVETGA